MSKRETGISRDGGTIDESTLSLESLISALPAVASRHGIPPVSHRPHPTSGATGLVFVLDRVVVKVPKADPVAVAALRTDVTVSQIALAHGIRAAPLIAFDERCDLLPVPFAIFARIPGQTLEELGRNASNTAASWEATGRQLARVHAIAPGDPVLDALRQFAQTQDVDPLPWVEELSAAGAMTPSSASTCQALIAQLAETARAGGLCRLCHGDLNAANVVVAPDDPEQVTLLDWAGAGWLDPVRDFVGVPLSAVPPLLRGHRSYAPLPDDSTAEARLIWCRLQTALHNALTATVEFDPRSTRLAQTINELARFAGLIGIDRSDVNRIA